MKFIDEAVIEVHAGNGGDGSASFRREKYVPRGGPDGGDGGAGGSILAVADRNINTLIEYRYARIHRARNGDRGHGSDCYGRGADDVVLRFPVGTVISDRDTGALVADLDTHGQQVMLAKGGRGGLGNLHFKSSTNRAPRHKTPGWPGEARKLKLELRVLADVGLLGMPNAGKSTLIAAISNARPKIADYPFTTLVPNLGVVRYSNRPGRDDAGTEFVVADIPGLIEGAAEGRGLGHSFLKHVEYARVLCVLLDMAPTAEQSPEAQLAILLGELGGYQPALLDRPRIVIGSRSDMATDATLPGGVLPVSSFTREGLSGLVATMAQYVDAARREEVISHSREIVVHRPVVDTVRVERRPNGEWQVLGRAALRAVRFQDLTNDEALEEVTRRLKEIGVDRLLTRAGALDGDVVTIGQLTFEWYRDATTAGLDRAGHHRATRRERLARQGRLEDIDDE